MKNYISPFIIVLTAITLCASLTSCKGAKSYVKRGAKMEAAGMIDSAVDFYSTALKKKPANLDALSGLNRTGQIILSRHLALFDEAILRSDKESAIRNFKNAESFYDKVNAFGVTLNFQDSKRAQYESAQNDHVQ